MCMNRPEMGSKDTDDIEDDSRSIRWIEIWLTLAIIH